MVHSFQYFCERTKHTLGGGGGGVNRMYTFYNAELVRNPNAVNKALVKMTATTT